jgi:hypothetical protein
LERNLGNSGVTRSTSGNGCAGGSYEIRSWERIEMTDKEKQAWDGVERRKQNLVVLPGKKGEESPPPDNAAAVGRAMESLWEIKDNIGRIFVLYETLDGKHLGCVDSSLGPEQVLMMIEMFKQWLLNSRYQSTRK